MKVRTSHRSGTHVRHVLGRWFGSGRLGSPPRVDPGEVVDFDRLGQALIETTGCSTLEARKGDMGRGLYTTAPVLPGAAIARSDVVIDARMARSLSARCGSLGPGEDSDPYAVLCFFLYQFLFGSSSDIRETEAAWLSPYRDVLLADTSSSVLDWADGDVALLTGSHLHTIATDLRRTGDATIETVERWVNARDASDDADGTDLSAIQDERRSKLRRCLSILLTRLVRLDDDDVALVPGIDLFNHDCSSKTYISGNARDGVRVINRDGFIPASKQAFVSYGNKTNGELLLSYGFVPEHNPHDGVLIALEDGTVVRLGVDGSVRVEGSGRVVDKDRMREELKRRVRMQLDTMKKRSGEETEVRPEQDACIASDVTNVMSFERKMLSKALFGM